MVLMGSLSTNYVPHCARLRWLASARAKRTGLALAGYWVWSGLKVNQGRAAQGEG